MRESLKRMSENVNVLIDKMNSESKRKSKAQETPNSKGMMSPENHLSKHQQLHSLLVDQEVHNSDKAIQNLLKER